MGLAKANSNQKLVQVQKYLGQRLNNYPEYKKLLERLDSLTAKDTREIQLQPQILRIINQFFDSEKQALWQEIVELKEAKLQGKNPEQFQKIINQAPHRCNRLVQNYVKVCKQATNQQKITQTNPFLASSLLYQVQSIIRHATVITQREPDDIYLNLVVDRDTYTQSIHLYVFELCENFLLNWLKTAWKNVYYQYNQGGLSQLEAELTTNLEILDNLVTIEFKQPAIEPQFKLEEQVELAALSENSQIVFDYNYTQSTWFRLLVALFIGGVIYLFTQRLFGFILLIVQVINLLTGQDTKKIRLRQQTKELKRVVDSKYQLLVRSLSEKINQEIAIALDNLGQNYQDQVEAIVQQADRQLQEIKHANYQTKEKIAQLKQDQQKLQSILD